MRRRQRASNEQAAWQLLSTQRVLHLSTVTPAGAPVLRVLNGLVCDGWVVFHGALVGEKMGCLEQPAVVSAHIEVALIPSYFFDPEMACPATSYYQSAQAHGTLRAIASPERKAELLQRLMQQQQPEGGHAPILATDPRYQKELRTVSVFGVEVEKISGKESLGQDRPAERNRSVVEGLWRRGAPGDMSAIRTILERSPAAAPPWLGFGAGSADELRFVVHPLPEEAVQAARLLAGRYWKASATAAEIVTSQLASNAWVGALDEAGRLVACARAVTDLSTRGSIYDVVVADDQQRRGIGRRLMRLLLDHPALRNCEQITLATKARGQFYNHLGFEPLRQDELMVRRRHVA